MAADYVDALKYIYGQQVKRRRDPLSVAQRTRSARSFIPAANIMGDPYSRVSRRQLEEQIQATALGPRGGDIIATPGEAPNVGAAVGYYDRRGKYLGPLYDQFGGKLAMPKGATGIHGTAGIAGGQDYLSNLAKAQEPSQASTQPAFTPKYSGISMPTSELAAQYPERFASAPQASSIFPAVRNYFSRVNQPTYGPAFAAAAPFRFLSNAFQSIGVSSFGGPTFGSRTVPSRRFASSNPYDNYAL